MAWYDTGTVSVTNGSTTVTGSGTNFISGVQIGEAFYGPDGRFYEIQAIVSATVITLADPYLGSTQSGQTYKIVPTQSLVADLTSQVSSLISDFQSVKDEAGEGKFDNGTAALPGITFNLDQDTGFSRPAANQIATSTGGTRRTLLSNTAFLVDVPITGTAVQSSPTDTDTNKLMKVGAFGLGGLTSPTIDLEAIDNPAGFFQYPAGAPNSPVPGSAGYGVQLRRFGGPLGQAAKIVFDDTDSSRMFYQVSYDGTQHAWREVLDRDDVQSSLNDTTADKLMKVGAFGLGRTGITPEPNNDLNLTTPSGVFSADSATANKPNGNTGNWLVWNLPRTPADSAQLAVSRTSFTSGARGLQHRTKNEGVWGAWRQIYQQDNILGTVSQSGGVPTGAVMEKPVSNANGFYRKQADGFMECWHTITLSAGAGTTWTFPSGAFLEAPVITGNAIAAISSSVQADTAPNTTSVTLSARDKTDARRADVAFVRAVGRWSALT